MPASKKVLSLIKRWEKKHKINFGRLCPKMQDLLRSEDSSFPGLRKALEEIEGKLRPKGVSVWRALLLILGLEVLPPLRDAARSVLKNNRTKHWTYMLADQVFRGLDVVTTSIERGSTIPITRRNIGLNLKDCRAVPRSEVTLISILEALGVFCEHLKRSEIALEKVEALVESTPSNDEDD